MLAKMKSSTYYFIGKLHPEEYCVNFNPREILLPNGWVLDVFVSGISIWNPKVKEDFNFFSPIIREMLDTTVIAFNFLSGFNLKYTLHNWVEAKEVRSKENIIGWIFPKGQKFKKNTPSPRNKFNAKWRRAGKSCLAINKSIYHKIALRDYQNCIDAESDDRFFYAYRIVEDIRRAVTRKMRAGLDDKIYWARMHKILGTNKSMIDPLTEVAEAVRHGDLTHNVVVNARKNSVQILGIGFDVMKREFKKSFKGLFN